MTEPSSISSEPEIGDHRELLRRVTEYSFDPPDARETFEDRLRRENRWPADFTRRVIEEYRRFTFLFAAAGHPVAPSDAVDQAWHLHLLYTRRYWDDFCKQVLQKPLHHEPATGIAGEFDKLADWYATTLKSYRRFFGEPPADIWPDPQNRTPKPQYRRVDIIRSFILPRKTLLAIVLATAGLWIAWVVIWIAWHRG